jgi:hypothetical protein
MFLRRLRIRLMLLSTIAWMVVCILVLFMWRRSWYVSDRFGYRHIYNAPVEWVERTFDLHSSDGTLAFVMGVEDQTDPKILSYVSKMPLYTGFRWLSEKPYDLRMVSKNPPRWNKRGFSAFNDGTKINSSVAVMAPYWAILIAASIPMFLCGWISVRRWRRQKRGTCLRCGYDLRASPQRCPECGLEVDSAVAVSADSIRVGAGP